uniref:NADH dehydrogenase subunit 2 n=1 Tax=Dictyocaulus eckerti TaxID=44604 RepID=K7QMC1_DICEC|nr:NADH dehydrogenase subunit 2 [Dictyocaulus eckerti]AFV32099.1 NADH dehydrogenase subunit 2 [Dictyocaulus eckerti]
MFFFFSLMTFLLSFLVMMFTNLFLWWSNFFLMTVMFLFYNKFYMNYYSIINYFVFQEVLGLCFLLLFYSYFSFLVLMMKLGVSPLHFWLFKVVNSMVGLPLIFFLTFHKLPFVLVFLQLFYFNYFFLLLGLMFTNFQMMILKNFKFLLMVFTVDSLSWLLMNLYFSFLNVIFLVVYYLVFMVFLLFKMDFFLDSVNTSIEVFVIFFNLPLTMGFFLKVYLLSFVFNFLNVYFFLLLLLMVMSVLSVVYWMIYFLGNNFYMKNNNLLFFLCLLYM